MVYCVCMHVYVCVCACVWCSKAEEKVRELKCQLDYCKRKDVIMQEQLEKVVARAERTMADKDNLKRQVCGLYLVWERQWVVGYSLPVALVWNDMSVTLLSSHTI